MRYIRFFLLHLQQVFETRSRVFVWFVISLFNPIILILFWQGAKLNNASGSQFGISSITTYYLLQLIVSSLLIAHIEEEVAVYDIQEGNLASYILKPFSYFLRKFYSEFSYRIFQGAIGLIVISILFLFYGSFFIISHSLVVLLLSMIIALFAYFISFTYKMTLGIISFWLIDIQGLFQLSEMMLFMFAGFIVPLYFFPKWLEIFTYFLPFPYIVYFPIIAFLGKLSVMELLRVIGIQIIWIAILGGIYSVLWKNGIKKFSGVGQ